MDKKIAMVVYSHYPEDPRVRREAEALVEYSYLVDVFCLRSKKQSPFDVFNGVNIYRLPLIRKVGESKVRYIWDYSVFIIISFLYISFFYFKKRYSVIHFHNMPDILVLSSIIPKLIGKKIILDMHDPMPEVYLSKYPSSEEGMVIRLLKRMEKFCINYADLVLTPNISFRKLFISRGCPPEKIHIVMNSPDEKIFHKTGLKRMKSDDCGFNLMYHGTIVERHGLTIALKAVSILKKTISDLKFHIMGDGDYVKQILNQINQFHLDDTVIYHGHLPLDKISQWIEKIDVGIIPNNLTPFTQINFPTRIFEYIIMNRVVIVPKTKGILDYFDENSILFFEPSNYQDLAEKINHIYNNKDLIQKYLNMSYKVYFKHRWELEKNKLVKLVNKLIM